MPEGRLSAIERTLETILEKVEVVVRLEERQDADRRRIDRQDARMDSHSHRIADLEQTSAANDKQTSMLERAGWVAASAVVGMLAYFIRS